MATPNMTSVRMTVLNTILNKFRTMDEGLPVNDPYGITWSTVALGPLIKVDQRKRYSIGLAVGPEKETFLYPFVQAFLTINIEFRVTVNRDDLDPGTMIEQCLTVIKRAMTEDRTWGGLVLDTKIKNSEIDLITYADRSAMGVCVAEIEYRYSYSDPRTTTPSN